MTAPDPAARAALIETLTALRAVMADERRAIARLDLAAIDDLTARKRSLVPALEAAIGKASGGDPELARLITRTRVELGGNAALIVAASDAIAALFGREPGVGYDRRARRQSTSRPLRSLTG